MPAHFYFLIPHIWKRLVGTVKLSKREVSHKGCTLTAKQLGLLFILVGPTGAGKNTLMNGVLNRLADLKQLPTATTRPIRPTEKEGREHHFVTLQTFQQMIDNNALLEWQEVHGRHYGVPRKTVADSINALQDRIADVDILGALRVQAAFPNNVILIFVQPGSSENPNETIAIIRERLQQRGETAEEIAKRLERVSMEMSYAPQCDYLIENDDQDDATFTLHAIITAERSRRQLHNLRITQPAPPLSVEN